MVFGAGGRVLVNPLRVKDWVISELEASLLLYFTGKSRTSADIIQEQSQNVRDKNELALEAMHSIKEEAFRMKECLLRGDFQLLHNVLRSSWESKKRMASQITNEHIERLYASALEAGAYCAKISGAGGGGFMMFLTDPIQKDKVAAALYAIQDGGKAYGCHFTAGGRASLESPPVMESSMTEIVREQLAETVALMQLVARDSAIHSTLTDAAQMTAAALRAGHKLMVAGNGGSAADAQHLAAEFVSRLVENRAAMRAVALTTDTSIITAIGNDYGLRAASSPARRMLWANLAMCSSPSQLQENRPTFSAHSNSAAKCGSPPSASPAEAAAKCLRCAITAFRFPPM